MLPGNLGGDTGPGLFIAYMLAAIPAAVGCALTAVIGAAYPVPAAGLALTERILPRVFVAHSIWLIVLLVALGVPLVALGFADFFTYYFPMFDRRVVAIGIVVLFMLLNCFGLTMATSVQSLLVIIFIATILMFGVGGIVAGDGERMVPLMPNGFEPILVASLTCYFSYTGASVVTELAGEIKSPGKNIPLTLLFGFLIILALYLLVPLALMLNLPWQDINSSTALVDAASTFLPSGLVAFISISALLAAATSINGPMMAQSRDLLFAATKGYAPRYFEKINSRTHTPVRAILLLGTLCCISILMGGQIVEYANMAVLAFMWGWVYTCVVLFQFPRKERTLYEASPFKYPIWLLNLLIGVFLIFAVGIFLFIARDNPMMVVALFALLSISTAYHFLSKRFYDETEVREILIQQSSEGEVGTS